MPFQEIGGRGSCSFVRKNIRLQPAYVRVLDDVDLKTLNIERTDCGTEVYVLPP
jgi:hypothetical protein